MNPRRRAPRTRLKIDAFRCNEYKSRAVKKIENRGVAHFYRKGIRVEKSYHDFSLLDIAKELLKSRLVVDISWPGPGIYNRETMFPRDIFPPNFYSSNHHLGISNIIVIRFEKRCINQSSNIDKKKQKKKEEERIRRIDQRGTSSFIRGDRSNLSNCSIITQVS